MAFFDKKEEVLDIQLTQFGKQLLSMGKFKPAYYAFFDDDIIYDSEYAGFGENRNDVGDRIRNETPNTKVQYVYSGIETNFEKAKKLIKMDREALSQQLQPTFEKNYALSAPLGNSSLLEQDAPAWSVSFLKGEIEGSVDYITGSYSTMRIPQIQTETVKFYTTPVKPALGDDTPDERPDENFEFESSDFTARRFEDGSYVSIENDSIIISVDEENMPSLRENFDIEVFIEEQDPNTGQETLTQLFFEKKCRLVDDNNILMDQEDLKPDEFSISDSTFVNHFFYVYVDEEISKEELCRLLPPKERESSFPSDFLDCEDLQQPGVFVGDLYRSEVTDEDIEDC